MTDPATPPTAGSAADRPAAENPVPKNMDRWLGDGGMEIIGAIGAHFDAYGLESGGAPGGSGGDASVSSGGDGERGWVSGGWKPEGLACNPHGIVQAGVHSVVLDAAMNFAINAGLAGRDRTKATLEMKTETMRVARAGDVLVIRGETVRSARQVAYAQAVVSDTEGRIVSRATGTFLLHREDGRRT